MIALSTIVLMAAAMTTAVPIGNMSDAPFRIGTQNHVHIFLNHYFLQMNADGVVDGALTDASNQTIWHRIARPDGMMLLRSSIYCTYLCVNECGYGYSALLPNGECLWSEIYDDFNNRFIVKRFENNRTAYLALNAAGKLKRVVLLKKEKLMDAFEQTHVFIKNSVIENDNNNNFNDSSCNPLNTKKLSYMPPKTCKNPPRHKKRNNETGGATTTPKENAATTESATMKVVSITSPTMIPDSIIWQVFNTSIVGNASVVTNITDSNKIKIKEKEDNVPKTVVNATIVNRMDGKPEMSNEVIPIMNADEVVYLDATMTNKTDEGAIPKNFYYHDTEFSIRTLSTKDDSDIIVKKKKTNSGHLVDDHDEVKESVEKVISKLIAAGNSTSYNAVPMMFVHHSTSLKICFA
nr:fgf [Spodoptera exigua multiple nucleopolyhedrovirus]